MSFGFAAVYGRPNVGKSTLVNAMVGRKVAITSSVAQTTRTALRGVVNRGSDQLVLVDTPGVHKPVTLLGERLNDTARRMLNEVDVVCFVMDAFAGVGRGDELLASWLPAGIPTVCVLNKVDRCSPDRIAEQLVLSSELGFGPGSGSGPGSGPGFGPGFGPAAWVPASALALDGVDLVLDELFSLLPNGEPMFPAEMATDQTERHLIAELIREQLLKRTREEIPHSIAVLIDDMEGLSDPDALLRVEATIYVERNSQKGIVIGRSGALLKEVGTDARSQIEALCGRRMYLGLRVKVSPLWQRRADALNQMGY